MRKEDKLILADPFLDKCQGKTRLPGNAVFACAYELDLGVDTVEEAVSFRRTAASDELWILEDFDLNLMRDIADKTGTEREYVRRPRSLYAGCAFAMPRRGKEAAACESLLAALFFSRVGLYWPGEFLLGGIIDKATYYRVKQEVEQEIDENVRRDRERETDIIVLARELGLFRRPTGTDPGYWNAGCPAKNHPLLIKADVNEFFCGYCRRKGGMEELRALVRERKGH